MTAGACWLALAVPGHPYADDDPGPAAETPQIELHGQATYIRQFKPAFGAAYSGPNSLTPDNAAGYSLTGTIFFGMRLVDDLELYVNPEVAQGVPFSDLKGQAAFSNGELARTSGPAPTYYFARAFLRKTWNLGGEMEERASGPNQLKTSYAAERVALTVGTVSAIDVFGTVAYSGDPRTNFFTWASLTHGAWDYPADARGYTFGAALEYITPRFSLRAARFAVPEQSNGLALSTQLGTYYGDVVEAEVPLPIDDRRTVMKVLGYRNRANMASYQDAIALGAATGTTPALEEVRKPQSKYGVGVSLEREIADGIGAYARLGWNDGRTETYSFTEIDRNFAAGVLVSGARWSRELDTFGTALYINAISTSHRNYLGLGGLGFFLGDGSLNYATERTGEIFYSLNLVGRLWLSATYQYQQNPGYNQDRGPVNFFGFRLHADI